MLRAGTLFILGAAVSAELDFPLGWGLRTSIRSMIQKTRGNENELARAINMSAGDQGFSSAIALRTALAHALSIDNLVEHHAADETFKSVAKLAIAAAISKGEEASLAKLKSDSAGTTYGEIFRLMTGGCGPEHINEALGRVSFITFNYDRSLEEYFFRALVEYSRFTPAQANSALARIQIVHVYGSLGPVAHGTSGRESYGAKADAEMIIDRADDIRTFSESTDSGFAARIKELVARADTVIMLGCANHRRNMDLLAPEQTNFRHVYGTYYTPAPKDDHASPTLADFSAPGNSALRKAIYKWQGKGLATRLTIDRMKIEPLTCVQLVLKYGAEWVD